MSEPMFVISEEEMKDIIDLTEEMCETPGWVINIQPIANRRMTIINEIRSRPHTSTPQTELQPSFDIIDDLERQLKFYKDRINYLQCWQSSMRDPERKIVCDILANGFTLTTKEDVDNADTAIRNATLDKLYDKANQRQIDVETEEGTIIEVIEKGEVLAWIDEPRTQQEQP